MAAFAASELPPRNFQAALAGLCKRNYYTPGDESLALPALAEALYGGSGLTPEQAVEHLGCAEGLLRKAAFDNWDPTVLEEAAAAQGLAAALAEVFGRVWRSERAKVHEALQKRSTWNSTLEKLSWRVDVKTASKDKDDLNEPSAIFELDTKAGARDSAAPASDGTTLRFEMSREQLGSVLDKFKAVEAQLALFK